MPLKGSDYALRGSIPDWLPTAIRRWARDLIYAEIHAMGLGLTGLPLGVAWTTTGLVGQNAIASIGLLLTAVALLRLPSERGVVARLLSRETWYFVAAFVLTAGVGWMA